MNVESEYCRAPIAAMFNRTPGFVWIPSRNIAFASKTAMGGFVPSGEPDGRVHAPSGVVFYVECKAFARASINLSRFEPQQENWYRYNCVESGSHTLHYIGLAVYAARRRPTRFKLDLWRLYLIPTPVWLAARDTAQAIPYRTATIPLTAELGTRKWRDELNGENLFGPYALIPVRVPTEKVISGNTSVRYGLQYRVGDDHPLWADLWGLHHEFCRKHPRVPRVKVAG